MYNQYLLPEMLICWEIQQRREEGCDLGDLPQVIETAITDRVLATRETLFWSKLDRLHTLQDEPSDLEGIRAKRPSAQRRYSHTIDTTVLFDRVYGAWLGRSLRRLHPGKTRGGLGAV